MHLIRHLLASPLAALLLACGPGNADDTSESSSTSGDAGPHAGAPDEFCHLDPARVYIHETPLSSLARFYTLVDLEDPSILCAVRGETPDYLDPAGWLDPVDGMLVTLRGLSDVRIVKEVPDWMQPNENPDAPWLPDDGTENDIELGEVLFEPGRNCREHDERELISDNAIFYASCGGQYFNAPELSSFRVEPLVGIIEGRRIWAPYNYVVDTLVDGEAAVVVPLPADILDITHVAIRPDGAELLAAIYVYRGSPMDLVVTLERAHVSPDGVTIIGAYTHDITAAGVEGMSTYALAADGTLYGLGGVADTSQGVEFGEDTIVVRLPPSGPPEVIYEATFGDPHHLPHLVTAGTAGAKGPG